MNSTVLGKVPNCYLPDSLCSSTRRTYGCHDHDDQQNQRKKLKPISTFSSPNFYF